MKGQPTPLNLSVLADYFGMLDEAPNEISPTDTAHLRRCMKVGLFSVDRAAGVLRLSPAGRAQVNAQCECPGGPNAGRYSTREHCKLHREGAPRRGRVA